MRWDISTCPQCGEPPVALLEEVKAEARLMPVDSGFDYAGGSEILWDSMQPVLREGKNELRCANYHAWTATPIQEP